MIIIVGIISISIITISIISIIPRPRTKQRAGSGAGVRAGVDKAQGGTACLTPLV